MLVTALTLLTLGALSCTVNRQSIELSDRRIKFDIDQECDSDERARSLIKGYTEIMRFRCPMTFARINQWLSKNPNLCKNGRININIDESCR